MTLKPSDIRDFQKTVYEYYSVSGRHTLPWRTSHTTPYHILVSEIMLQQTQVERVVPKFLAFVTRFPTVDKLAKAPQSDVLRLWVGLGYNRRALHLHAAAKKILADYAGKIPRTLEEIMTLPGIGPYTGAAVLAFAYDLPTLVIETNIRTVYIHHFFQGVEKVSDADLLPFIKATQDLEHPRRWYTALMDYGSHLKKTIGNATRQSKMYTKQSKFVGSTRQFRGIIIRELTTHPATLEALAKKSHVPPRKLRLVVDQLIKEGFIKLLGGKLTVL